MSLTEEECNRFYHKANVDDEFKCLFDRANQREREVIHSYLLLHLFHYFVVMFCRSSKQLSHTYAAGYNWMEVARFLIEEGKVDVDCKGGIPILEVAAQGSNKMIEYFNSIGANINAKRENFDWNALHFAAANGHSETVKLLVSLGCDFKAQDWKGKTPLEVAQQQNKKEVVEFLKKVEQQ
jgi:ankyrin repeat protein